MGIIKKKCVLLTALMVSIVAILPADEVSDDWNTERLADEEPVYEESVSQESSYAESTYEGSAYQGETYQGGAYQGVACQGGACQGGACQGGAYQGETYQGETYQGETYQGETYQGGAYQGLTYGQTYNYTPQDSYYCTEQNNYCCIENTSCDSPSGRFFVRGDLLYWKPHVSNLELDFGTTEIFQTFTDDSLIIFEEELDKDPHFKWNTGYRVAAGYQLPCSEWEIGGVWTHFEGKGSNTSHQRPEVVNRGTYRMKFNQLDLLLGYNTSLSSDCVLKPFIGIRAAKINEHVHAHLVTDILISPGDIFATRTVDLRDHQSYRGIGPVLGVEGDWGLGCGFGLYGSAATSLLYGRYKVDFKDVDIFTPPFSRRIFSNDRKHVRAFDCTIDLALGVSWQTCLCNSLQLTLKLGFEHHQYFNHSRFDTDRGDLSMDGGVFSASIAL